MLRRRGATRLGSRRRTLGRAYEVETEFVERLLVEEGVGRGELELQLEALTREKREAWLSRVRLIASNKLFARCGGRE